MLVVSTTFKKYLMESGLILSTDLLSDSYSARRRARGQGYKSQPDGLTELRVFQNMSWLDRVALLPSPHEEKSSEGEGALSWQGEL